MGTKAFFLSLRTSVTNRVNRKTSGDSSHLEQTKGCGVEPIGSIKVRESYLVFTLT